MSSMWPDAAITCHLRDFWRSPSYFFLRYNIYILIGQNFYLLVVIFSISFFTVGRFFVDNWALFTITSGHTDHVVTRPAARIWSNQERVASASDAAATIRLESFAIDDDDDEGLGLILLLLLRGREKWGFLEKGKTNIGWTVEAAKDLFLSWRTLEENREDPCSRFPLAENCEDPCSRCPLAENWEESNPAPQPP